MPGCFVTYIPKSLRIMNVLGVIPARYGSTRFPGKPLIDIGGKTMIQRVYEQSSGSRLLSRVIVATDDDRILEHVHQFGGEALLTSTSHRSGTERIGEILDILKSAGTTNQPDLVVNIQGDEPFLDPSQLDLLIEAFQDPVIRIGTLMKKITDVKELEDPNVVKVVIDVNGFALYFSRSTLPFYRNLDREEWTKYGSHQKHIGLYAYRAEVLEQILKLSPTPLEAAESLEQLRWLEHGFRIKVISTSLDTIAIDTPEDLLKFTNNI